jgi:hypothetical protein
MKGCRGHSQQATSLADGCSVAAATCLLPYMVCSKCGEYWYAVQRKRMQQQGAAAVLSGVATGMYSPLWAKAAAGSSWFRRAEHCRGLLQGSWWSSCGNSSSNHATTAACESVQALRQPAIASQAACLR